MATYPELTPRATGTVTHTLPEAVEAGGYQRFVLTYRAGYFGVDDTGSIKICWRYAADIGTPQFDEPAAAHYVSARASNGARRWHCAMTRRITSVPGEERCRSRY